MKCDLQSGRPKRKKLKHIEAKVHEMVDIMDIAKPDKPDNVFLLEKMKRCSTQVTNQIREIGKQVVIVNTHKTQLASAKVDLIEVFSIPLVTQTY